MNIRTAMNIRAFTLLLSCSFLACSAEDPPETGVVVVLRADTDELRGRIDRVNVSVEGGRNTRDFFPRIAQDIDPVGQWPLRTVLAPLDGDTTRAFRYVATAYDNNTSIGRVRAIGTYLIGNVVEIRLTFEPSCEDRHGDCTDRETCSGGVCENATRRDVFSDAGPFNPDAGPFGDSGPFDPDGGFGDSGPFFSDAGPPVDGSTNVCGDGIAEGPEECDDGNSADNDGCSFCVINFQCDNTCGARDDGDCDDGRVGADFAGCALGTDCNDCGPLYCDVDGECPRGQCLENYCTRPRETDCGNGIDDDMDTRTDCDDPDCMGVGPC